ncbi:MAG: DUF6491 family protein [Gammaproteobacteria bacterium]|jgi:hypothetical protein
MGRKPFTNQTAPLRRGTLRAAAALLAVAAGAAGCAGTGGDSGSQARLDGGDGRASDCIFSSSIRDFTALDNRNLILDAPGSRAYHVVLTMPSMNLESEFRIGVVDRDGDRRICPFGRDRILIDGPLREELSIRSIRQIDEEDVEALKVEFGLEEAAAEDAVTVTEIE